MSATRLSGGFDGGDTVEGAGMYLSLVASFASSVALTAPAGDVTEPVALSDVVVDAFDAATAGVLVAPAFVVVVPGVVVVPVAVGAVIAGEAAPVALLATDSVGNDTNGPSRRSKFKVAEVNVFTRSSTSIFCVK